MPTAKLTKKFVTDLVAPDPSGKTVYYWDTELKGFGVMVSGKTSTKTYVVQKQISRGNVPRDTVGATNIFSLDKARDIAIQKLALLSQGVSPRKHRREQAEQEQRDARDAITFGQALDKFLAEAHHLRPRTASDYRAIARRHLTDWADRPLRSITRADVVAKHRAVKMSISADDTPDIRGSVPGGGSANSAIKCLRKVYNHAMLDHSSLPPNPVVGIKLYKEPRREDHVSANDMGEFYKALMRLPNQVQRDYLLLVLFTGFRREEAAALTWDEVDLQKRVIRLPQMRTKAGRRLDLPTSDVLHKMLSERRKMGVVQGGWVFPAASASGHIAEPRFALDLIEKETGIEVTVHGLRRTFITVAESCEISHYAIKGLVNHAMGRDVTGGYIMPDPDRLRGPMQAVADRLKELCGIEGEEPVSHPST